MYNNLSSNKLIFQMEQNKNIDSLTLNKKIFLEKRRRHQIYTTLDYISSHKNMFDFYSSDTIFLLKRAQNSARIIKQKKVTTELLLLAFFTSDSELLLIFKKFNLSFPRIFKYVEYGYNLKDSYKNPLKSFFEPLIKNNFLLWNSKQLNKTSEYNYEVKYVLEKALENAFRFKTPILSPEIFFLTLLEEKNTSAGQLLKLTLKTDLQWNLLRYELLKKIHNQESKVQGNIFKNSRYFAYILKSELTDLQFEKLLKQDKYITRAILNFRDLVINNLLSVDLPSVIYFDVKTSIKATNLRTYSN